MSGDAINSVFEATGAVFMWRSVLQLHRDREIKGVYWPTWAFFAAWGIWNLYYYPSLNQWWSFAAGSALAAGNMVWVALAARITLFRKDRT